MPRGPRVLRGIAAMRGWSRAARGAGRSIGFVPTMGALHEGHLRLVRRARRDNDALVASIFVNPIQFGPGEDYARYPRPLRRDLELLAEARCDVVFAPASRALFPPGNETRIVVPRLSGPLCGRFRPGHFEGVATVVAKLLHVVEPDRLYLGQKDYQQSRVVRRMIRDLDLPVRLTVVPTVREADGLAMSSRNRYLSAAERRRAPGIYAALLEGARSVKLGERSAARLMARVRAALRPVGRVEYVEALDADTLAARPRLRGRIVIAAAVFVGRARLIDNILVRA